MDAGIFVYPNFLSAGEAVWDGVGQEVGGGIRDHKRTAAGRLTEQQSLPQLGGASTRSRACLCQAGSWHTRKCVLPRQKLGQQLNLEGLSKLVNTLAGSQNQGEVAPTCH